MMPSRLTSMIVSGLLIVVLLLVFTDPWSTFRKSGDRIVLKDPEGIDRILLYNGYDSTHLVRKGETWMLFGQEPVNQVAVENLLFAAARLQINSIVSADSIIAGQQGRRVQFYEGERIVVDYEFMTLGRQYMVRPKGSDQAFFVSIAGFGNQNLEKVFSCVANHYRDHLLIDLSPSEISLIEIELSGGEAFRFIQDEEGNITCLPSNDETVLPPGSQDEISIRLLFSYFTSIPYEQRAGIQADSLTSDNAVVTRMASIHVVSFNGEEHSLQIFPYHETAEAEPHMFKALLIHNNKPEVLVVNYIYLDVLMRELSHYFEEK